MVSVSSWISPKARKGTPSAIAGRGLFAVEPIAGGEVVAVEGGHIVDTQTMRSLPEKLRNNHSCEPNVGFAGNVVLAAMRDVAVGEELTTDYALFDTPDGSMVCSCGTVSCRGRITGEDWHNPDLQRCYAGRFSRYLADRMG